MPNTSGAVAEARGPIHGHDQAPKAARPAQLKPETFVCPKCSHEWAPRKPNPAKCPNCKLRLKEEKAELVMVQCLRCGEKWPIRTRNPKQCPRCHRYDWNQEKEKP